ncbi:MAG: hypothetical protein ACKV0T_16515 [Planctomycetales bacterium]
MALDDGEIAKRYAVKTTFSTYVLIDRTGRIARRETSQFARPATGIPDDRQVEELVN